MDSKLLMLFLNNIAVPEILAIVRRRLDDGGTLPTEDEIRAQLAADAVKFVAQADAFLDRPAE